jgi:hypothetical protein
VLIQFLHGGKSLVLVMKPLYSHPLCDTVQWVLELIDCCTGPQEEEEKKEEWQRVCLREVDHQKCCLLGLIHGLLLTGRHVT